MLQVSPLQFRSAPQKGETLDVLVSPINSVVLGLPQIYFLHAGQRLYQTDSSVMLTEGSNHMNQSR